VKTDRCTMANSLEARAPFLDRELVEYVAALPDEFKLQGRRTKAILRDAFSDLLPPEIQRRGKMGFGVPIGTWFREALGEHYREVVLASDSRSRDYLDTDVAARLLADHQSGRWDHGHRLWVLLMFELWARKWLTADGGTVR